MKRKQHECIDFFLKLESAYSVLIPLCLFCSHFCLIYFREDPALPSLACAQLRAVVQAFVASCPPGVWPSASSTLWICYLTSDFPPQLLFLPLLSSYVFTTCLRSTAWSFVLWFSLILVQEGRKIIKICVQKGVNNLELIFSFCIHIYDTCIYIYLHTHIDTYR